MNFGRKKRRGATEINLTSLIDIVFQLLIFFLLTAKFAPTPGIDVILPRADAAKPLSQQHEDAVVVDSDGQIFFQGAMVGPIELKDRLALLKSESGINKIVVFADEMAPHGRVTTALNVAVDVGLKTTIATGN